MKKSLLSLLFIIYVFHTYSQQTQYYNDLTSQIDSSAVESFKFYYKNGILKEERIWTQHYYKDIISVPYYSQTFKKYWKSGVLKEERLFDNFGCVLEAKFYNKEGILIEYLKTLEIDTKANTLEELILKDKLTSFIIKVESFDISKHTKEPILVKEGVEINGYRSGIWKIYKNGGLHKTIDYGKVDKFSNLEKARIRA